MEDTNRISIKFAGMDGWARAVFVTQKECVYYKSVELMPHPNFNELPTEDKEILLRSLHTTDEFDGEPDTALKTDAFEIVDDFEAEQ